MMRPAGSSVTEQPLHRRSSSTAPPQHSNMYAHGTHSYVRVVTHIHITQMLTKCAMKTFFKTLRVFFKAGSYNFSQKIHVV